MDLRKNKTYNSWRAMRERCSNPKHKDYDIYGGKGISVCDEWQKSFKSFLEDMGERPDNTTLDRIDSDLDYNKDNCRWATHVDQCRNQSIRKDNTSGCKGVNYSKHNKQWCARISVDGKRIHLGYFKMLDDAIKTRKEAEKKYWL